MGGASRGGGSVEWRKGWRDHLWLALAVILCFHRLSDDLFRDGLVFSFHYVGTVRGRTKTPVGRNVFSRLSYIFIYLASICWAGVASGWFSQLRWAKQTPDGAMHVCPQTYVFICSPNSGLLHSSENT